MLLVVPAAGFAALSNKKRKCVEREKWIRTVVYIVVIPVIAIIGIRPHPILISNSAGIVQLILILLAIASVVYLYHTGPRLRIH